MPKAQVIALYLLFFLFAGCLKSKDDPPVTPPPPPPPTEQTVFDWPKIADSAQGSLSYFYNSVGKFYYASNTSSNWVQYWPTAHTLDVLVDAYLRTSSAAVKTQMDNLLSGMYTKNGNTWINHFYDDMEWMTLASLRAYNATNDSKYKDIVDILWADIKNGWSNDLGGGIWWNKDRGSKNACSNGPAAIIAARLYQQFRKDEDLQWAKNIYNWEKTKLYNGLSGAVLDNMSKDGNITNWIFTYNQGTFAGAAFELYKITGESFYLTDAVQAIDYSFGTLANSGILKDEGGGDGGLFKAVLIRYFTHMLVDGTGLTSDKRTSYANLLIKNAQTLWAKGTNKQFPLFAPNWTVAPANQTDLTTQLSGIVLIESAALAKKNGLF